MRTDSFRLYVAFGRCTLTQAGSGPSCGPQCRPVIQHMSRAVYYWQPLYTLISCSQEDRTTLTKPEFKTYHIWDFRKKSRALVWTQNGSVFLSGHQRHGPPISRSSHIRSRAPRAGPCHACRSAAPSKSEACPKDRRQVSISAGDSKQCLTAKIFRRTVKIEDRLSKILIGVYIHVDVYYIHAHVYMRVYSDVQQGHGHTHVYVLTYIYMYACMYVCMHSRSGCLSARLQPAAEQGCAWRRCSGCQITELSLRRFGAAAMRQKLRPVTSPKLT